MLLVTGSSFMRVFFWIVVLISSNLFAAQLVMAIFFLPVWLDFAALSLLAVFYAETVYGEELDRLPRQACFVINLIFFALNLTISLILDDARTSEHTEKIVAIIYIVYAAFVDFFISVMLAFLGHRFIAHNTSETKVKKWVLPRSIREFATVNWTIVSCYCLRGVLVSIFSTQAVAPYTATKVNWEAQHPVTPLFILGFFLLAEIVPNVSVLYLLWHKRSTRPRNYRFNSEGSDRKYDSDEAQLIEDFLSRQSSVEDSKVSVIFERGEDEADFDYQEDQDKFFEDSAFETGGSMNAATTRNHSSLSDDRFSAPILTGGSNNVTLTTGSGLRSFYRTPSPQIGIGPEINTNKLAALANFGQSTSSHSLNGGSTSTSLAGSYEEVRTSMVSSELENNTSGKAYANTFGPREILQKQPPSKK